MATTTNKRAAKQTRTPRKSRWRLGAGIFLAAALLAGAVWFSWHAYRRTPTPATEVVLTEPPAIELAGVDVAVIRAIEAAQTAVKQSPRSSRAWGHLGKILLAHDFPL